MSRAVALRAAGLVGALVVAAWFALGVVQAHDLNRASSIISGPTPLSASAQRSASSALSTAGTLNPDRQVDLLRAQLAIARGDRGAALRIIEQVTRSEPDFAGAWLALATTARVGPLELRALKQIARLLPPVGRH